MIRNGNVSNGNVKVSNGTERASSGTVRVSNGTDIYVVIMKLSVMAVSVMEM
jgi:hypothetical protein